MIDYKHLPANTVILNAIKQRIDDEKLRQCLNRYVYRFRLASAFVSLNASGLDKRTLSGYSVATKLFLAYSAYDEIREAEKILINARKPRQHKTINFKVANHLRRNKDLQYLLTNSIATSNQTLRNNLHKFYAEGVNEVMCIATALRNCYAHGDLTAGGAGLSTQASCNAIYELTDVVLQMSNEIFNEILS